MTDKELWAAAWAELSLTTDSYPTWVKKGKPASSHWAKAKTLGDQIGAVTPPPPSGWTTRGLYLGTSGVWGTAAYTGAWDAAKATGIKLTSAMCPLDPAVVNHIGARTWVLVPNGYSQAQVAQWLPPVMATGLVDVVVVFDEPGTGDLALCKSRTDYVHASWPGVRTATTHYDAGMITATHTANASDILVVDNYPSRSGWDLAALKACVAACDASGLPYTVVLDTFQNPPNYPLPTPAQLQAEIDYVRTTRAFGVQAYTWGDSGGDIGLNSGSPLLDVLRAL